MIDNTYRFEKRLAFAATPPSSWYTEPRALETEKEKVFARTWQLVGRTEMVARPGQYFTATIGDEPIIVVCDSNGTLRAFSNVCRHRAGPVACGEGERRTFQCGYHGWTYALDGRLIGTPEFDGVECWSKEANRLPSFKVETWGALVFVNLDPNCEPLSETLGEAREILEQRFDLSGMSLATRKDWRVACNWKVYVDNYLEGYHIPIVHPSLNRELEYTEYRTDTARYHSVQHSPIKRSGSRKINLDRAAREAEVLYFWFFPNLMVNVYPDNFSTNLIVPLGAEQTLTVFEWYYRDAARPDVQEIVRRAVEFSDEIQREDIAICEAVQRGLRSPNYRSGRYSVKRENGVHHFHSLLSEFLQGHSRNEAAASD